LNLIVLIELFCFRNRKVVQFLLPLPKNCPRAYVKALYKVARQRSSHGEDRLKRRALSRPWKTKRQYNKLCYHRETARQLLMSFQAR